MTGESELSAAKVAMRKAAAATRKAACNEAAGAAAAEHLLGLLRPHAGEVISGYMPIRSEISPLPAMSAMVEVSPVVVPVMQGAGLPLIFREWHPGCQMIDGPFGALVPAEGTFLTPRVLIVPLLAFDRQGYRLGYGGGFYDRTLEELRHSGAPLAIGIAFAGQEVAAVPRNARDQRLDMIVTEEGAITF